MRKKSILPFANAFTSDAETMNSSQSPQDSRIDSFRDEESRPNNSHARVIVGKLWIHAMEGRDLIDKDINGLSDPYLVFKIGRHSIRTSTIYKSLNPQWNEQFTVDVYEKDTSLEIEVFDEDAYSFNDDFMGQVSISLKDIGDASLYDKWYTLRPRLRKEKVTGEIHIKLRYVYGMETQVASIQEILMDQYNIEYFLEFLREEFCPESLLLYLEIEQFKEHHDGADEARDRGNQILEKFIYLEDQVNLTAATRKQLLSTVEKDPNWWSRKNAFQSVQREMYAIIEGDLFLRFIRSDTYNKLVYSHKWVESYRELDTTRQRKEALTRLINVLSDEDFTMLSALVQKRLVNGVQANGIHDMSLTPQTPPQLREEETTGDSKISLAKRRAIISGTYVPKDEGLSLQLPSKERRLSNGGSPTAVPSPTTKKITTPKTPPSTTIPDTQLLGASNLISGGNLQIPGTGNKTVKRLSILLGHSKNK